MTKQKQDCPFNEADLERAWVELRMLDFRPDPETKPAVKLLLSRMVPHRRALRWLIDEVVNHVGKWPGPAELRGLLCKNFDPADGIDQWCSLPGYTIEEAEAKYLERHAQLTAADGYIADEAHESVKRLPCKPNEFTPELMQLARRKGF